MKKVCVAFLVVFFLNSSAADANSSDNGNQTSTNTENRNGKKSRFTPDSMVFQTAGFVGFVAAGPNWKITDSNELTLLIGYLPESVGGVEIWHATLKYEWHPFSDINVDSPDGDDFKINPLHIGFSAIYGAHKNLFRRKRMPSQYPSDYYAPTAIHLTLNIGTSIKVGNATLFVEYSALDKGLESYFNNQEFFRKNYNYWGLEGIGSLGFGIKVNFR